LVLRRERFQPVPRRSSAAAASQASVPSQRAVLEIHEGGRIRVDDRVGDYEARPVELGLTNRYQLLVDRGSLDEHFAGPGPMAVSPVALHA
jgi:hypothetical protein